MNVYRAIPSGTTTNVINLYTVHWFLQYIDYFDQILLLTANIM